MTTLNSISRRSFIVMSLALAACKTRQNILEISGVTMGTTYNIAVVDPSGRLEKADVQRAASAALSQVNKAMSNWDSDSEISRFNAATPGQAFSTSPELAQVMQAAADVSTASEGRFDTTIGPLIELWGFGAPGSRDMPGAKAIAEAQAKSGHGNALTLGARSIARTHDDAQVYLAGIGKGFGADHVGRAIEALGVTDYMVEIGGDLYAAGRNPDGLPWQIGIESPNPGAQGVMGIVGISGMGLASSGDYRNYFEMDGKHYSHLIDPVTGRPVDHKTASATVIAENAMLADAWSTAMLILGRERGLEIAAQHGIAVQFVDRTTGSVFETVTSDAFATLTA